MRTGRRPDTITDERQVAERVRKLEVMPNPRTIPTPTWAPNRDDLYAIAGHIYMLGCFGRPYETGGTGPWAKVHQASQHLWATLDERGFTSEGEAQQWTGFLAQMGALVNWVRYQRADHPTFTFNNLSMNATQLAEARPTYGYKPWLRIGFVGASDPEGEHRFQARALWFHGIPPDVDWTWLPQTPTQTIDLSGYYLWDGAGPVNAGYLKNPDEPVISQNNYWLQAGDPPTVVPCGAMTGQFYNDSEHLGIPVGLRSGPGECDPPAGHDVFGSVTYQLLGLPASDMTLICPPRIQHPDLLTNDLRDAANINGGENKPTGPGLDWLAEGADTLLGSYPAVQGFYSTYLPIAYGNARRAHHYTYQQLQTSVAVRGRVEARYQPDRVILKGQLYVPTEVMDPELFHWPETWTHPAEAAITAPAYTAGDGAGGVVPLAYNRLTRRFVLENNWVSAHQGPRLIHLDGMTIPLKLNESLA